MSKLKILEEAGKYINYHETKQQIKSHTVRNNSTGQVSEFKIQILMPGKTLG